MGGNGIRFKGLVEGKVGKTRGEGWVVPWLRVERSVGGGLVR